MFTHPHGFMGGYGNDFVIEMATTGAAETVTIPCANAGGAFSANINWGDGTADSTITTWNDGDLAHEYADAGDHIIRISGTFPNIKFNGGGDYLKLKRILNWGATGLVKLELAFTGCTNLTSIASESSDTSGVDTIWGLCSGCTSLTSVTGSFNLAAVTTIRAAFQSCSAMTTCDVSGWDTTLVTLMNNTFQSCTVLTALDVSGWDTGAVTTMDRLFMSCPNLATLDVSGWDTTLVADMSWMFQDCDGLTDLRIDLWNIEAVTTLSSIMQDHVGLTTARYDAVLIAWDAQNPIDSLTPNFGGSTYTGGGAAATARASLESGDSWTITDGGIA